MGKPRNQKRYEGTEFMEYCMIIERSTIIRKVAVRILSNENISVAEADNSYDALQKCDEMMPETFIIDTGMPDNEAFKLMRSIRELPGGDKPIIIALMHERDLVTMTKARRHGADDFMLKPFDRNQLLASFYHRKKAA